MCRCRPISNEVAVAELQSTPFAIDQCRRFYAEEIRAVAGLDSPVLVAAFARVPRERFLGLPPWRFSSGSSLRPATYRSTNQVRDLYHDVFVALKGEPLLNSSQPSVTAKLIAALDLSPGKRILHVGCGTGYYSAILSEMVGHRGTVIAIEIDPDLAARASVNLAGYPNVLVLNQGGATIVPEAADAILVNSGVTHPAAAWLDGLGEAGVLAVPFLVGRSPASNEAMVFRIVRQGRHFAAEPVSLLSIFPSNSLRNPAIQSLLNAAFESYSLLRVTSVRREAHPQSTTCIVHTAGFCLSAEAVDLLPFLAS